MEKQPEGFHCIRRPRVRANWTVEHVAQNTTGAPLSDPEASHLSCTCIIPLTLAEARYAQLHPGPASCYMKTYTSSLAHTTCRSPFETSSTTAEYAFHPEDQLLSANPPCLSRRNLPRPVRPGRVLAGRNKPSSLIRFCARACA